MYNIAIVGATGAVGQEMISILAERNFPAKTLRPLASERSFGEEIIFKKRSVPVEVLAEDSFNGVHIALFSAGAAISKKFAPIAARAGAIVVDNSSAFRMDKDVPLIIPEVNADAIEEAGIDERQCGQNQQARQQ